MSEQPTREKRDLVLAPSEYAFMQDVTKGIIKTYTGPTVINPTAQERPVVFNQEKKRFEACSLESAVQSSIIAPEGYYVMLKNPSVKGDHPAAGNVQPSPDLDVGRKINIHGPCDFALWPGQLVKLVQGHNLRSNQYLLVRVYNEDEARKNWSKAIVKPAEGSSEASGTVTKAPDDLTTGQLLIIKGTEVSFYIPPTGVAVVKDIDTDDYVRDALTLEQLDYCIMVDEDGGKRYERGPQVVFPEPTEKFIVDKGEKKFRAIELNELQGIHLKVIAAYKEANGTERHEGEELFVTGKETAIYFPRAEHSMVKYDGKTKHFATAIPAGEARYVMNRNTGKIVMVKGPAMLLPDPRNEVIVRRVLSDRQVQFWYPGNEEALLYNRTLREILKSVPTTRQGALSEGDLERGARAMKLGDAGETKTKGGIVIPDSSGGRPGVARRSMMESSQVSSATNAVVGDQFDRASSYSQPRSITLDTKYEGVPNIEVWTGYAVMISSKSGGRRVVMGPETAMLEYDERLEVLELSTGKPKTTDKLLRTVFLRVVNNKNSDRVYAETLDHVNVQLDLSFKTNFEGPQEQWWQVENYVKFLCDHVRSVLKGVIKKHKIEAFYGNYTDIVRDTILGKAVEGGVRPGMAFKENGMRILDVEVLGCTIGDSEIAKLLSQSQHEVVQNNIMLSRAQRELEATEAKERIQQSVLQAAFETVRRRHELKVQEIGSVLTTELTALQSQGQTETEKAKLVLLQQQSLDATHKAALAREADTKGQLDHFESVKQERILAALVAETTSVKERFQSIQGGFSEALIALKDAQTLEKVAEAISVQHVIGGDNAVDVLLKVFAGTPLAGAMAKVVAKATAVAGNGNQPRT